MLMLTLKNGSHTHAVADGVWCEWALSLYKRRIVIRYCSCWPRRTKLRNGVYRYVTVLYDDFPVVVVVVVVRVPREQADGAEADEATHDVSLPQPGRRRQGKYVSMDSKQTEMKENLMNS